MNTEQLMAGMKNLSSHGPHPPKGVSPKHFFDRLTSFWRDASRIQNGSEQFKSQFEQFSQFVEDFANVYTLEFEGKSCQRKRNIQDSVAS